MAKKKTKSASFDQAETVAVLTSPLRIELVQTLAEEVRLTVGDLAQRLGVPRASLYYHIKKLLETGLIVEVERQLKGKKYEAIYEVAAERILIETDPESKESRDALVKLMRTITRLASREFERALEAGILDTTTFESVRRQRAWLTDEEVEQMQKLLGKIEKICSRRREVGKGRLFSFTSMVVPLEGAEE